MITKYFTDNKNAEYSAKPMFCHENNYLNPLKFMNNYVTTKRLKIIMKMLMF